MKKLLIVAVVATFVLFPMTAFCVPQEAVQLEEARHRVVVVGYRNGSMAGAGIVVGDKHILTAYHVVAIDRHVRVQYFNENRPRDGEVIFHDAYLDLALIEVGGSPRSAREVQFREGNLVLGEPIFAIGHPITQKRDGTRQIFLGWSVAFGRIMYEEVRTGTNDTRVIQYQAATVNGFSGGGIFDAEGLVVALHSSSLDGTSIGLGVPVADMTAFLGAYFEVNR